MMKTSPVALAAVVLVAAAASVTVFTMHSGTPPPTSALRVINPQHNSGGGELPNTPEGTAIAVVTYPVCTTGSPVMVQSVEPVHLVGKMSVGWAITSGPWSGTDGIPSKATDLPGFSHAPVSARCGGSEPDMLALDFTTGTSVAGAAAFRVHFPGGSVVVPFTMVLCSAARSCPHVEPGQPQ